MASFKDIFSPLQLAILAALPRDDFTFLSGAGALSGQYLGHRTSKDLDFFCVRAESVAIFAGSITAIGHQLGAAVERKEDSPGFRRLLITRGAESTLVDVVYEPVPQIVPFEQKPLVADVRVDSLPDLIANKLSAILGRSESKDLVDLYFLSRAGHDPLAHLESAKKKDGGLDVASLSYAMSQVPTDPKRLRMVQTVSQAELEVFRDGLLARLLEIARTEADTERS